MADGLGRRHQWRPDTASSRRKGIQTGRGDFCEIPDCAVLRELLPPPRLMLGRETLVCPPKHYEPPRFIRGRRRRGEIFPRAPPHRGTHPAAHPPLMLLGRGLFPVS